MTHILSGKAVDTWVAIIPSLLGLRMAVSTAIHSLVSRRRQVHRKAGDAGPSMKILDVVDALEQDFLSTQGQMKNYARGLFNSKMNEIFRS
mmetsp:Transcript_57668/g.120567  ORF Transcript_57668/g.120567 Transcript_57668/m.120567 type:complete len:91 (-) Transcript_57668:5-277(-)